MKKIFLLHILVFSFFLTACQKQEGTEISPLQGYEELTQKLSGFISHEMESKDLPALSLSLVEGQKIVWAAGFGMADPEKSIPATPATVYRIGSVSKLFTDIGVMQLVEKGKLDLDAPVTDYLPSFRPKNPFGKPITLRQLMSHRSGLLREPPIGNYFDNTGPTLSQTIDSLNATELVYEPGTQTKYSNAGIGVVGRVLEVTQKELFAPYLKLAVLRPMGLEKSSFSPEPEITKNLARAFMWTPDGRVFDAPTFELGMAPAGCMYSTVADLARFIHVLFKGGEGPEGRVLQAETLEKMWTPQFAPPGQREGFGLGFNISEVEGRRCIRHGGAIYGFATELEALPGEKLGVAVATTVDAANSVCDRIANYALRLMLAQKHGLPLPGIELTGPVPNDLAQSIKGKYASDGRTVDLLAREGRLFLDTNGLDLELKSLGNELVVDDRLTYGPEIALRNGKLRIRDRLYERLDTHEPPPAPSQWENLIGEYGWDYDTLYILEKEGKLYALIEWFFAYPLKEISEDIYAFPDYGLYRGEKVVFTRSQNGQVTEAQASGVVFKRRPVGTISGQTFTIIPLRPAEELKSLALAASPPEEKGGFLKPDLVDLSTLDPSIKFDIRYATTNNFMQTVFYEKPKAFLQRPAAEALLRVQKKLKPLGYGLLIHDAYRPWYVTKMFWDATPEDKKLFVADPANGSRHNRGCAVDLTLYDLKTGLPVQMTGGYDEMTDRSNADYLGGTSLQRWHRDLLRQAMEEEGFSVYKYEWWHYDYKDWQKYSILNLTFDHVENAGR